MCSIGSSCSEFLIRGSGEAKGIKKRIVTVSSEFRNQLNYLMDAVAQTAPHFIRCIKPNPKNVPEVFDRKNVTEQLRYGGVLQAVQVSRAGYPVRLAHREAYFDYRYLCSKEVFAEMQNTSLSDRDRAVKMMTYLDGKLQFPKPAHASNSWAVGQTMVFLKHESYEVLASERASHRAKNAAYIQSMWKGIQQRRFFVHLRNFVILIQVYRIKSNTSILFRFDPFLSMCFPVAIPYFVF